ncbi:GNAT family N-acetyltransferase [Sporomusa malonica]|uniref:N-acetyltransferase domain-containing protein n=1 Tax=Sporomusa malonica TaxID=112901 RepID=A0A1W2E6I7_9FIRM|nr:hypothetical protein [Sporomusa malonica]SMD05364.1 hypothetical protein SAMN04488500_12142 [Sporomusa malonica]
MTVPEEQLLVTGRIRSRVNKQWYPYTMRVLKESDLPSVLELYDFVVENIEDSDMLWRYANETVVDFLGQDGIVAGVFVDRTLVGFRVMYFHHEGDPNNPLLCNRSSYGKTAHLALCVVHPEFRGNSLQKHMGVHLLRVAQASRPFPTMCSIVSPHNYPSISDKFSLNMVVVKLMPKFRRIWRYIFYRDMDTPITAVDKKLIFAASYDYPRQIELLEQGYYGVQLGTSSGETGLFFRKLR